MKTLSTPEPFLRWAGGKRQLVHILRSELPKDISDRTYVEPFLGAGSLFFDVQPSEAILSDANESLIATYRQIKRSPKEVLLYLRKLIASHSSDHYYRVRKLYNSNARTSPEQAARFIYLNKTCFNGIFRVNVRGEFNVPKGSKEFVSAPSDDQLEAIRKALRRAKLNPCDYRQTLAAATERWFVYLDPPYPALNGTAYFTHYTADRFHNDQQKLLADECRRLHNLGALFLLSNADLPEIRKLYSGFRIESIPVRRYISCKGERLRVSELLIKNYE